MDMIGCSSNAHQNDSSEGSHDASENNLTGKEAVVVNRAEKAWNQMRKKWVGDPSKKAEKPPKVSTICPTARSDDMLFSDEPYRPPIPLAEMVGYFVKIWEDEGLYRIANR